MTAPFVRLRGAALRFKPALNVTASTNPFAGNLTYEPATDFPYPSTSIAVPDDAYVRELETSAYPFEIDMIIQVLPTSKGGFWLKLHQVLSVNQVKVLPVQSTSRICV